jgi:hypothetical protein
MRRQLKGWGIALACVGSLLAAESTITASAAAAKKTAMFNVEAVHSGPGMKVTINSKVWVSPTQARADVKHPVQGEVRYLVSNGSMYMLDPKQKRGVKGPLPPELKKSADNFTKLIGMFAFNADGMLKSAKKVKTESVAGYPCDVFSETRSQAGTTRAIMVWMPQQMTPKFPLKASLTEKVAKPDVTMEQSVNITLSGVQLNTAFSPSIFAVPSGYKIVTGKPGGPKPGK